MAANHDSFVLPPQQTQAGHPFQFTYTDLLGLGAGSRQHTALQQQQTALSSSFSLNDAMLDKFTLMSPVTMM